jgi:exodeoxyribonuclease VII small subunit
VDAINPKISFEVALAKLEAIVESMESGDVPLADLLARFEQGTKLLKVCETRLKDAELKIEQLKKTKENRVVFEKFESEQARPHINAQVRSARRRVAQPDAEGRTPSDSESAKPAQTSATLSSPAGNNIPRF